MKLEEAEIDDINVVSLSKTTEDTEEKQLSKNGPIVLSLLCVMNMMACFSLNSHSSGMEVIIAVKGVYRFKQGRRVQ